MSSCPVFLGSHAGRQVIVGQFPWRTVLIGAGAIYLGGMVLSLAVGIPLLLWMRSRYEKAQKEMYERAKRGEGIFEEFIVKEPPEGMESFLEETLGYMEGPPISTWTEIGNRAEARRGIPAGYFMP